MHQSDNRSALFVIAQTEVVKELADDLTAGRHDHYGFSGSENWKELLCDLEEVLTLREPPVRPVLFVSLEVASYIRRERPFLRRGLLLDPEPLRYDRMAGVLPQDWLLNRSFILLPFGTIQSRKEQLRSLYGDRIFLRPASALKPFSGNAHAIDDLNYELDAIRQIEHIFDDELCVIDRAQRIAAWEFRAWIVNGRAVTIGGYSHDACGTQSSCPAEVQVMAKRVAKHIEPYIDPVVADFVLDETGQPRLIEMNALSTSGFYGGMDLNRLLDGLDDLLV